MLQDSPLPSWLTLPPTPNLPSNISRAVNINGVDLWYADYVPPIGGVKTDAPNPVVCKGLHFNFGGGPRAADTRKQSAL